MVFSDCPECRALVQRDGSFCASCGANLNHYRAEHVAHIIVFSMAVLFIVTMTMALRTAMPGFSDITFRSAIQAPAWPVAKQAPP